MPLTLTDAREMLEAYIAAERAVLCGQTTRLGDRLLTYANLEEIRKGRQEWERKVDALAGGGGGPLSRVSYGVPR